MPIYRKGEDQSGLFQRASEQRDAGAHAGLSDHQSEANTNGYIVGMNPEMTVSEIQKSFGNDFPISASGVRRGTEAKYWKDRYPHMWNVDVKKNPND